MGLFQKKTDKEKAVEKIKEQQENLKELEIAEKRMYDKMLKNKEKIKEDIKKMTKLAIVDGKLIPVEKDKVVDNKEEPKGSPFKEALASVSKSVSGVPTAPAEAPAASPAPAPAPASPAPAPAPAPLPDQEISIEDPEHPQHEEYLAYQRKLAEQQVQAQELQEVPPQQAAVQPQAPPPQTQPFAVEIMLDDHTSMKVQVEASDIKNFIDRISESINDQSIFQIGNRILNGRHIVYFTM